MGTEIQGLGETGNRERKNLCESRLYIYTQKRSRSQDQEEGVFMAVSRGVKTSTRDWVFFDFQLAISFRRPD